MPFQWNDEMKRVKLLFEQTTRNFLVLGGAGTGKSALLKELVRNSPKNVAVVAPTGIAALQAGGFTIHKFFGLRLGLQKRGSLRFLERDDERRKQKFRVLKDLQVLFIDEISMVRADVIDAIDAVLREHGPRPGEPFGGVQIGLFGDVLQLAPIVNRHEVPAFNGQWPDGWTSPWFFDSRAYPAANFVRVFLAKSYRHLSEDYDGEPFIRCLQRLREDRLQDDDFRLLNSRVVTQPVETTTALVSTNRRAASINHRRMDELPGTLTTYRARKSDWPETWGPEEQPVPETVGIKPGARVMVCANISGTNLKNGTPGVVEACRNEEVDIMSGGVRYTLRAHLWEVPIWNWNGQRMVESGVAKYEQIPLKLGWAITINKAQGQTIEGPLWVDLSRIWAGGQCYVALSRTRRLEHLMLAQPVTPEVVRVEPKAIQFLGLGNTALTLEEYRRVHEVFAAASLSASDKLDETNEALFETEDAREDARELLEAAKGLLEECKLYGDIVHNALKEEEELRKKCLAECLRLLQETRASEAAAKKSQEMAAVFAKEAHEKLEKLKALTPLQRLLGNY